MEELYKKWENHHCLQALDASDQEEEAERIRRFISV